MFFTWRFRGAGRPIISQSHSHLCLYFLGAAGSYWLILKSSFSSTAYSAPRWCDILGGKDGSFSETQLMMSFCPVPWTLTNLAIASSFLELRLLLLVISYLSWTGRFQRLIVCLLKCHPLNWECLRRAKNWEELEVCCLLADERFLVPALVRGLARAAAPSSGFPVIPCCW